MARTAALIVAAGSGERLKSAIPKAYVEIAGKSLVRCSAEIFASHEGISKVVVVISPEHQEYYDATMAGLEILPPAHGGATRQASVRAGLEALNDDAPDYVLIHDAARPFASHALIDRVLDVLHHHPAAIPVLPLRDTIKQVTDGKILVTLPREMMAAAQTPQGFHFKAILDAHGLFTSVNATDDASLAEMAGMPVYITDGELTNIKITTQEDLMQATPMETRTGTGFDVHPFRSFEPGEAETIALCGVNIPAAAAVAGHSDADAGLHALVDAMLGAIGQGDIGQHFPPSDAQWKGADSAKFVTHALSMVKERGGRIINADVTIICEAPKVGPHREAMRTRIAQLLEVEESRINIKATTTEKLGFLGRGEGIAAQASVNIQVPMV